MPFPLISEYIEAIKSAEDNFEELSYLRPVLGEDGEPVMTSGNFAVVFKMEDRETGKFYALKCFTKDQEGRAEAYHQIADELKDVDSPYLVSLRYLDKELFVDTEQTAETEFPVLLMDWVEGKTLDKYLRENLDDKYALEMLAYRFSQLAQWLIPQPFAHGDLKPDNILVREDGTLVLVDYDGMYVPAMRGQKARELGSPDFRHPQRTEDDFDKHIDDFPAVFILLSLKCILFIPELYDVNSSNVVIFSEHDLIDMANCATNQRVLELLNNREIARLYAVFLIILAEKNIDYKSYILLFKDNNAGKTFEGIRTKAKWSINYKYDLAYCIINGLGYDDEIQNGIKLLIELAQQGKTNAQNELGRCFYYGIGIYKNIKKSIEWFEKAAEQGNPEAQCNLGVCIYNHFNFYLHLKKIHRAQSIRNWASEWFAKAAAKGNIVAVNNLGVCMFELGEFEKAIECFLKASKHDDSFAFYNLGVCFRDGKGVNKDYEKAIELFLKSARCGNSVAEINLGNFYFNGYGYAQNYEKAIEYYTKAAEKGNAEALYNLGFCCSRGYGFSPNWEEAIKYLVKSACLGNRFAQYELGMCYKKGLGVSQNKDRAKELLSRYTHLEAFTYHNIITTPLTGTEWLHDTILNNTIL